MTAILPFVSGVWSDGGLQADVFNRRLVHLHDLENELFRVKSENSRPLITPWWAAERPKHWIDTLTLEKAIHELRERLVAERREVSAAGEAVTP